MSSAGLLSSCKDVELQCLQSAEIGATPGAEIIALKTQLGDQKQLAKTKMKERTKVRRKKEKGVLCFTPMQ